MKLRLIVLLTAVIAAPAFAHDPSMHKDGDAKDPDCAQMDKMDMSKMDPKDPVVKAMHTKCAAAMKHEHDEHVDHDHKADPKDPKPNQPNTSAPPMKHDTM